MPLRARYLTLAAALAGALSFPLHAQQEWLSLGSKHWAPTVVSKSGIGTANAVAEARVMRESVRAWCENWAPGDRDCVNREMASPEARKTYRASADCIAGRITAVDGNTYTLAGRWDHSDIGGGRSRWRDANGRIVGRDNASGGLGIAQQWELLCPAKASPRATQPPRAGEAPRKPSPTPAAPAAGAASYAVGEIVYARYGPAWIRGKVTAIRRVPGANGPELAYNVTLDNGERGLLPPTMMRKAPR